MLEVAVVLNELVVGGGYWAWHAWRGEAVGIAKGVSLGAFARGRVAHVPRVLSGRARYVSLEYEVEADDKTREIEVLFSAKQAAALATHLEVAAFPHASLLCTRRGAPRQGGPGAGLNRHRVRRSNRHRPAASMKLAASAAGADGSKRTR